MDFDQLKQWMEFAKRYQNTDFWNGIFEQSSFNQFMKDNVDQAASSSSQKPLQNQNKFPPLDIYVTDREIYVLADLAGYPKENIHVSVLGIKLMIKGSMPPAVMGNAFLQERHQGEFQRIIELPEPTDPSSVRAQFQNGLLLLSYKRQYMEEQRVNIE